MGVIIAPLGPSESRAMSTANGELAAIRVSKRAPDPLAARRHVERAHARRRERVEHRVDDDRQRADGPCLARPLRAEEVQRRRRGVRADLERAQIIGARHAVVHERRREELPRLPVVDDLLHQRLPRALRDAAVDLTLERQRIDHRADVVDHDVRGQPDLARLGIDLDLADVTACRVGERRRRVRPGLVEAGFDAGRQPLDAERRFRHLLERHRAVGTGHDEPPRSELHVGLGGLEQMGRDPLPFDDQLVRRDPERGAADRHRARAERTDAERHPVGVAVHVPDVVRMEPEALMDELLEHRFVPLPLALRAQEHETMFKQLVHERLGLHPDDIRYVDGDTDRVAFGVGTFGSRTMAIGGSALWVAADKLIVKGKRIAAHLLEASEPDIEFAAGRFVVAGTDRAVPLKEVAKAAFSVERLPPGVEPGFYETGTYAPTAFTYPASCHVCEVEVDPETGEVRLAAYVVVDDVGTVINPLTLKGQVHGGVAQGAGQALMEQIVYDRESGQLLSASFMDYCMPRADDLCAFEVGANPTPTPLNLLGAKGAGEAGTVGALPVVINAVLDALAPTGVRALDMPASRERVWRALRDGSRGVSSSSTA